MDKQELHKKVEVALEKIKPYLQADGGDISLVNVTEEGIVHVQLLGACGSCPMSTMTLKNGVEKALMKEIPEVKEVVQV